MSSPYESIQLHAKLFLQKPQSLMGVSVRNQAAGNLNDMRFHMSIYFTACRGRI